VEEDNVMLAGGHFDPKQKARYPEWVTERLAAAAYEINRAYCDFMSMAPLVPWDDASEAIRRGYMLGVEGILYGTVKSPEEQHAAWMNTRLADGWSWAAKKDDVKKTHPCLVPYGELPQEQRVKDTLFRAAVAQGARLLQIPVEGA
jgi:hypothetical protein